MTTQAPQLEAGGNAALPPPMPLASLVAEAPRKSPRPPPVHWAPMATSPLAPSPPSSALAPRRRMTGASSSLRSWSTSGRSARSSQVSSHLGSPADAPHLPRARQPHPPRRTRASHDDAATTGSGDNVAFIDSIPPVSPLLPTSPATPATPGTPSTTAARFFFLPTGAVSGGAKGVESAANEYGRWCAACDDEEHKQDLLAKTQAGSRPRSDIAAHRRWEMSARSVASVFTSRASSSARSGRW